MNKIFEESMGYLGNYSFWNFWSKMTGILRLKLQVVVKVPKKRNRMTSKNNFFFSIQYIYYIRIRIYTLPGQKYSYP